MKPSLAALILALATPACGSTGPEGKDLGGPPRNFEGFPSQTIQGAVYAQARFDNDHRTTFGEDLIDDYGIVPVLLSVQRLGEAEEGETIMVLRERMNPRLFLQDGTALRGVSADEVASSLDEEEAGRVRKSAFEHGLIGLEPREGYVFFALEPEERFGVRGRQLVVGHGGITAKVDIANSLLAFTITVGNSHEPFYVGIQR